MVVLIGVSLKSLDLVFPISIVIAVLLGIVALSYTQIVRAYETSGGAYVVAKDNLGTLPALVAGAALLVDYVLTVSVSVAGESSRSPLRFPGSQDGTCGCASSRSC